MLFMVLNPRFCNLAKTERGYFSASTNKLYIQEGVWIEQYLKTCNKGLLHAVVTDKTCYPPPVVVNTL